MASPVTSRLRTLTLHHVRELNRLAYDDHHVGIAPSLQQAVDRAQQVCPPALAARQLGECIQTMQVLGAPAANWVGALTSVYAAALASSCWSKIDPNDLHELIWRFDIVAESKIERVAVRLQTLALARELLTA